ncbi:MAG: DUF4129 domain-containing protein [Verrucomicrobiota bacterium]
MAIPLVGGEMSRKLNNQYGRGAVELIEEAVHLLRTAPVPLFVSYYLGGLPFVIGFLYFWADLSRSAFAQNRCAVAALGLSTLFLWMKGWQAVFASQLRARISLDAASRWSLSRAVRLAAGQMMLQPSGLFLLPIALIVAMPFGWAYAFYQNMTALGNGESEDFKSLISRSWQQARLWPAQNHLVISILFLFGIFVFLNLVSAMVVLPELFRMLTGVETQFTRSIGNVLNTTFFATAFWLAYLCVDPIAKAVYVLRCFYGEALRSGEDLKAELKSFPTRAGLAKKLSLSLVVLSALVVQAPAASKDPGQALTANPQPRRTSVVAAELDRSIEEVLSRREFSWRLPRETVGESKNEKSLLAMFVEEVIETIKSWANTVGRWMKWLVDYFRGKRGIDQTGEAMWLSWLMSAKGLILVLLLVLSIVLLALIYRLWRRRQPLVSELKAEAIQPAPDLKDETVAADQLSEDGWIRLGRQLLERGEFRIALRAFYLASLAHLAERELITIARFKSNHEYERELRRRAHALPELTAVFEQSVTVFERVWYGLHDVNAELVQDFSAKVERIKAC